MGVISYVVLNVMTGKAKEKKISLLMYVLAVLFVLKYLSYKIEYFYEELQAFVCGSFLDGKLQGSHFRQPMQEAICVVWIYRYPIEMADK